MRDANVSLMHGVEQTPRKGAWLVLGILCFVYVLNFLDRQLLSILAKPIQDDLGVTDGQLGLISGLYFALFYCIISIPVAWLADRTNRVKVLSIACGLWSLATVACGMASTYPQLVLARMTVGVGEAGGVPPSYAIITDYFPPSLRGRALGLFNLGPPIGQALGVAFGAAIAAAYDWRLAFIILGVVGVIAAFVVFFVVREPERGGLDVQPVRVEATAAADEAALGFWPTCKMFCTNPTLMLAALGSGANQFITYATLNFATLFLMREKGMTLEQIAVFYAILIGVAICGGMYVSGRMLDVMKKKSKAAYGLLPGVALILAIPCFVGFVWAPTWPVALAFMAPPLFLNYFYLTPSVALIQEEVKPRQRVLSGAILLLVMNLLGLGLGPTYLGLASDFFARTNPEHSLQMAFYTLTPFYVLASVLFLILARRLGRESKGVAA
ncbi:MULTISPECIES: spinster family MFS transporter [unclassified Brevundimonas]|uniref:spinster family MFS transporter n=1 Tax=unclassified Brevundimonas TaxID=2622653 RepID=UPI003F90AE01